MRYIFATNLKFLPNLFITSKNILYNFGQILGLLFELDGFEIFLRILKTSPMVEKLNMFVRNLIFCLSCL